MLWQKFSQKNVDTLKIYGAYNASFCILVASGFFSKKSRTCVLSPKNLCNRTSSDVGVGDQGGVSVVKYDIGFSTGQWIR